MYSPKIRGTKQTRCKVSRGLVRVMTGKMGEMDSFEMFFGSKIFRMVLVLGDNGK